MLADTGSSWFWVKSCGDKAEYPFWDSHPCPKYYFDRGKSTTVKCSGRYKYIEYGGGAGGRINGEICSDFIKVSNTGDMKAKMPFLLLDQARDFG